VNTFFKTVGWPLAVAALLVALLPVVFVVHSEAGCCHRNSAINQSQQHPDHTCCMVGHNHALATPITPTPARDVALHSSEACALPAPAGAIFEPALSGTSPPGSCSSSPIRI